jgi:heme-degrading monooxygenase HmoA
MIAVIFEAVVEPEQEEQYLEIAAKLRSQLEAIDGFISIERFHSLAAPGKILSLSFWRDEDSVKRWRIFPQHRDAQNVGRDGIFDNYRIRVATVTRDYSLHEREQAPSDSLQAHDKRQS